jgi:hypothetical protein
MNSISLEARRGKGNDESLEICAAIAGVSIRIDLRKFTVMSKALKVKRVTKLYEKYKRFNFRSLQTNIILRTCLLLQALSLKSHRTKYNDYPQAV